MGVLNTPLTLAEPRANIQMEVCVSSLPQPFSSQHRFYPTLPHVHRWGLTRIWPSTIHRSKMWPLFGHRLDLGTLTPKVWSSCKVTPGRGPCRPWKQTQGHSSRKLGAPGLKAQSRREHVASEWTRSLGLAESLTMGMRLARGRPDPDLLKHRCRAGAPVAQV